MCMEIKSCFHHAMHGFCGRKGYLGQSAHLISLDEYESHLKEKVCFIALTFFTLGIANLVHWIYQYRSLDQKRASNSLKVSLIIAFWQVVLNLNVGIKFGSGQQMLILKRSLMGSQLF